MAVCRLLCLLGVLACAGCGRDPAAPGQPTGGNAPTPPTPGPAGTGGNPKAPGNSGGAVGAGGDAKAVLETKRDLAHIGLTYHIFYADRGRGPHNAEELLAYQDPAAGSLPGNAAAQAGV